MLTKLPKRILILTIGILITILDSEAFRLFAELLVYLLGFFAFLLFTWLMVTGGLGWAFT